MLKGGLGAHYAALLDATWSAILERMIPCSWDPGEPFAAESTKTWRPTGLTDVRVKMWAPCTRDGQHFCCLQIHPWMPVAMTIQGARPMEAFLGATRVYLLFLHDWNPPATEPFDARVYLERGSELVRGSTCLNDGRRLFWARVPYQEATGEWACRYAWEHPTMGVIFESKTYGIGPIQAMCNAARAFEIADLTGELDYYAR